MSKLGLLENMDPSVRGAVVEGLVSATLLALKGYQPRIVQVSEGVFGKVVEELGNRNVTITRIIGTPDSGGIIRFTTELSTK